MSSTKAWILPVVLVILLGGYVVHPHTTLSSSGADPAWDEKMGDRDQNKPTLLIFTADWCGACNQLRTDVLSRRDIQNELYDNYNVYWIDLTAPSSVIRQRSARYHVSAIPTLIRFNRDGKETARRHSGSAEDVMAFLRAGE